MAKPTTTIEKVESDFIESEVQHEEGGIMSTVKGALSGLISGPSGPTASKMWDMNKRNLVDASKLRLGEALLERIREGIIRPMLPKVYDAEGNEMPNPWLENPFICGCIDLAVTNMLLYGHVNFGDKLPPNLSEILGIGVDCMDRAAFHKTLGVVNVENILKKALSGDIMEMIQKFRSEQ